MADIFISYARSDREKVELLASALEGEGYSVWWDRHIDSGAEFSAAIERELEAAKAVIVCWSEEGAKSRWVKDEATIAHRSNKLKTISLDGTEPPIGYMQFHSHGMSSWKGGRDETQFVELRDSIAAHLAKLGGAASVASSTTSVETPTAPTPTAASTDTSIKDRLLKPVPLAIIGAVVVALIALVTVLRGPSAPSSETIASESGIDASPSIAVLPFIDLSPSGDQEYFADGISEEILNVLVRIQDLKVAGRTSSFSYKGKNDDLREIGSTLGVNHILEGSVRKSGTQLRITAQLIRSADGFHLWSETYDRELVDIFNIQDEIAQSVAEALAISLGLQEVETVSNERTDDTVAYENYLKAKTLIRDRGFDNLQSALLLLQEATTRDPNFIPAWVQIGAAYGLLEAYAPGEQAEREYAQWRAIGRAAVERALTIDANNAQALIMLAQYDYYDRDFVRAMVSMERALEFAPDDAEVHDTAAQTAYFLGYFRQALTLATRAAELDPLGPINWNSIGHANSALGDVTDDQNYYREAIKSYQKSIEVNPALNFPYTSLAGIYFYLDRLDDFEQTIQSGVSAGALPLEVRRGVEQLLDLTRQGDDALRAALLQEDIPDLIKFPIAKRLNDPDYAIMRHEEYLNSAYQHEVIVLFGVSAEQRQDPRWKTQVEKSGILNLWQTRGFPFWCRPLGTDDFECD